MKIIGVIPARYKSSRFPGKPLANICGKPMIWWVYQQALRVNELDELYVATDDDRIMSKCDEYGMRSIMTSPDHPNHIHRVYEVAGIIDADLYVCINGDEPLIEPNVIKKIINNDNINDKTAFVCGLMRNLTDPAETIDITNIKIVTDKNGNALYMSRIPIPYPKGSLLFNYKKYVGVEGFNKKALDFFVSTKPGTIEITEDIDHLRFLENGIKIHFSLVDSKSLSVDTAKDLEKVSLIISKQIKSGEKQYE